MLNAKNRVKKIRNYLNNVEIKKQLHIVYFFAGILPILTIGIYLMYNTSSLLLKQQYSQVSADNTRVRSILLDTTIALTNISDDIFRDYDLLNILSGDYATREESYSACRDYSKFNTYSSTYTEVSKLTLYHNNSTLYDYGHFVKTTPEISATDWYKKAAASYGYHWMTVTTLDTGNNKMYELGLVRKIPVVGKKDFAVLFISVSKNYLKTRINTSNLISEASANDMPLFYTAVPQNTGKHMSSSIDFSAPYFKFAGIAPFNGEKVLMEISTIVPVKSQDKIYIATIDDKALPNTIRITVISCAVLLVGLFVPFIMISLFSGTFSSRMNTLRHEMHKVSLGQLEITEDFKGKDELVDLYTDLKVMIQGIKRMDEEIYHDKIVKQKLINHQQEMQLEMLANQINPHFLFNTLETIRMKAHCAGDAEVATAIKLLGKSMRHVLDSGGRLTTLLSELEHVSTYLEIQKIRFGDRINYEIIVSDDVDSQTYMILPILLQPIVENAFVHGLENIEKGGFIRIEIKVEGEDLLAVISDNGAGMSEPELNQLMESMKDIDRKPNQKSIGLYNIYQRIQLYYGSQYGMDIQSTENLSTVVTITLPLHFSHKDKVNIITGFD